MQLIFSILYKKNTAFANIFLLFFQVFESLNNIGATEKSMHGVILDYSVKSENALEYTLKLIENE